MVGDNLSLFLAHQVPPGAVVMLAGHVVEPPFLSLDLVWAQTNSRLRVYPVGMTPRPSVSFPADRHNSQPAIEDSIQRVIAGWRVTRPELQVEPIAITARLARLQAVLSPRLENVFARYGMRGADFAVIA